jgi:hypothetical protein
MERARRGSEKAPAFEPESPVAGDFSCVTRHGIALPFSHRARRSSEAATLTGRGGPIP